MDKAISQEHETQFGKIVLQKKLIAPSTLASCMKIAQQNSKSLSQVFIEQGHLTKEQCQKLTEEIVGHPKNIGRYEILGEIGSGGMGKIYQAYDTLKKETVALKTLLTQNNSHNDARFLREAKTIARLKHPNIISLIDLGKEQKQYFFTMEYVKGKSLDDLIKSDSLPTMRKSIELLIKIAKALHYAHKEGVIHRDIKPANIMLDQNGEPKVMDFGLAKIQDASHNLSVSGTMIGTLTYMAPEQAEGRISSIDARSDVYALGALLYALLTGRPPFTGQVFTQVLQQILTQSPVPPSAIKRTVSKDLDIVCLKALAKEKSQRYQTAEEIAEDLERLLQGQRVSKNFSDLQLQISNWIKHNGILLFVYFATIIPIAAILYDSSQQIKKSLYKEKKLNKKYLKEIQEFEAQFTKQNKLAKQYFSAGFNSFIAGDNEIARKKLSIASALGSQLNYSLFHEWLLHKQAPSNKKQQHLNRIKALIPQITEPTDNITYNILGRIYLSGILGKKDVNKAIYYHKKAADKGFVAAVDALGALYLRSLKDYPTAIVYFQQAAQQNFPWSLYFMGEIYRTGLGVKKDLEKAKKWYRKAVNAGNSNAMARLGRMYRHSKEHKKAFKWLQKSIKENKLAWAMYEIGLMYYYGLHVTKDTYEGISWLNLAVDQNDRTAVLKLANLRMGNETPKEIPINYEIARNLWLRVKHFPKAQFNLGKIYEKGLGVKKDIKKSLEWYRKAAKQKDKQSIQKLKKLRK